MHKHNLPKRRVIFCDLSWSQPSDGTITESKLSVSKFNGNLTIPNKIMIIIYYHHLIRYLWRMMCIVKFRTGLIPGVLCCVARLAIISNTYE